jgi:hypothetical protein
MQPLPLNAITKMLAAAVDNSNKNEIIHIAIVSCGASLRGARSTRKHAIGTPS